MVICVFSPSVYFLNLGALELHLLHYGDENGGPIRRMSDLVIWQVNTGPGPCTEVFALFSPDHTVSLVLTVKCYRQEFFLRSCIFHLIH